jgi:hypothetical protein
VSASSWHHKAHLDRKRLAQCLDLLGEAVLPVGAVDQRQQRVAELDLEIVDLQRRRDRLFRGRRSCGSGCGRSCRLGILDRLGALELAGLPGHRGRTAAERQKRNGRNPRQQRQHAHHGRRHAERLRIAGELLDQRLVGRAGNAGLRHQEARGGRDDQRRDLGDEAVADGEQRVRLRGFAERKSLLRDADDDAADDVDEDDEQARHRVAAHEFGGTVHGAEEAAFVLQRHAALARRLLVDQAGVEVGIDRHLLARHSVQMEARRNFRDAARTLGDDDEVHGDEDREHDDPDHEIAAHHEIAESLDDMARGVRALVPAREDQPRGSEVERQPQHGRDQKRGRKRREFQRRLDEQRRHQDQDRQRDRDRQEQVEDDRGQG